MTPQPPATDRKKCKEAVRRLDAYVRGQGNEFLSPTDNPYTDIALLDAALAKPPTGSAQSPDRSAALEEMPDGEWFDQDWNRWVAQHCETIRRALSQPAAPVQSVVSNETLATVHQEISCSQTVHNALMAMVRELVENLTQAVSFLDMNEHGNSGSKANTLGAFQYIRAAANIATRMAALPLDKAGDGHDSDCSTHNMPAYLNGPCDCGNPNKPPLIAVDDHIPDATQDGDRVALATAPCPAHRGDGCDLCGGSGEIGELPVRILGEQP